MTELVEAILMINGGRSIEMIRMLQCFEHLGIIMPYGSTVSPYFIISHQERLDEIYIQPLTSYTTDLPVW